MDSASLSDVLGLFKSGLISAQLHTVIYKIPVRASKLQIKDTVCLTHWPQGKTFTKRLVYPVTLI